MMANDDDTNAGGEGCGRSEHLKKKKKRKVETGRQRDERRGNDGE